MPAYGRQKPLLMNPVSAFTVCCAFAFSLFAQTNKPRPKHPAQADKPLVHEPVMAFENGR